jgi:hypothetical protein
MNVDYQKNIKLIIHKLIIYFLDILKNKNIKKIEYHSRYSESSKYQVNPHQMNPCFITIFFLPVLFDKRRY